MQNYKYYCYNTTNLCTKIGIGYRFYIPENVYRLFDDEFDYREYENSTELIDKAVASKDGVLPAPIESNPIMVCHKYRNHGLHNYTDLAYREL